MTYKIGIKRFSDMEFNGEQTMVNNDYWTTVEADNERQAKLLARHNIVIRIAQNELRNVRLWKCIYIDLSDLVVGE